MTFEEFAKKISVSVMSGKYTFAHAIKTLNDSGYQTTRDIPEKERAGFIEKLEITARSE